jgi:hypothetical protein
MAVIHSTCPTGAPLSQLLTGAELRLKQRAKLYAGLDPARNPAPACPDCCPTNAASLEVRDGH